MAETVKIRVRGKLAEHMDGMGFAYGEDYPEQATIYAKMLRGEALDPREAHVALFDGIESALAGLEAIAGSAADFEEGRDIAAARRSGESLKRKLTEFLVARLDGERCGQCLVELVDGACPECAKDADRSVLSWAARAQRREEQLAAAVADG